MNETVVLPSRISAEWIGNELPRLEEYSSGKQLILNCTELTSLDSVSRSFFLHLHRHAEKAGGKLIIRHLRNELKQELSQMPAPEVVSESDGKGSPGILVSMDRSVRAIYDELKDFTLLLSEAVYWSTLGLWRKKTLLWNSVPKQMVLLGSSAVGIVILLSFLIGFTLAVQSAVQLAKFGATIFLASGIGLSMVTEIGPVMTAVILAGRSGSAITAEISTMVVQEEISALHTMAINRLHFLVLPRFWALTLMQPLLTACSILTGILAGLTVGVFLFDLSMAIFINELLNSIDLELIFQAFVKSVTFAWIICLVALVKGFRTQGGADAVGKATTSCVVTCIFCIILADAVFSFFFYM